MKANLVSYVLFVALLLKETQGQVLLDVQLLGFENKNNLETRPDNSDDGIKYCCCDSNSCSQNKTDNKFKDCPQSCDVFFNVKLSECRSPTGCFISTMNVPITDSPSNSSSAHRFSFIIENILPHVQMDIEMRDVSTASEAGELIDKFSITVSSPVPAKPKKYAGTCELATIIFDYMLTSISNSVCSASLITTTADETQTVTVTATSTATVPCTETKLLVDANTAAITATLESTARRSEVDLHLLSTTMTVNHTPGNAMVDQSSKSSGSQTAWIVVAILFLVIAISAIILSTFMGYLLYKKTKTFNGSSTVDDDHDTKEPSKVGGFDNPVYSASPNKKIDDPGYYECGPVQNQESSTYELLSEMKEVEPNAYEVPVSSGKNKKEE